MKILLIATISLINYSLLFGQSSLIELQDIKLKGYVFENNYEPQFKLIDVSKRFTPTIIEVKCAEGILSIFDIKNRKIRKKLRRQYLGFEKNGIKYLLIHAMYYKREKQFKRDFPDWDKSFAYLITESKSRQKSFIYIVNLKDNTIGFY